MDYEKNPEVWQFQGEKPCLIDFYADWCAPCRITSPILEDLAKQYAGKINVYKIDIEKEKELAAVFGVQSIPTFLFCPLEGKPTISSGIANTPDATRQMFIKQIEELLLTEVKTSPAI
jgi:thioredoxin